MALAFSGCYGKVLRLPATGLALVNKIAAIEPSTLRELYENPAFVPSLTLDQIEPVLR